MTAHEATRLERHARSAGLRAEAMLRRDEWSVRVLHPNGESYRIVDTLDVEYLFAETVGFAERLF